MPVVTLNEFDQYTSSTYVGELDSYSDVDTITTSDSVFSDSYSDVDTSTIIPHEMSDTDKIISVVSCPSFDVLYDTIAIIDGDNVTNAISETMSLKNVMTIVYMRIYNQWPDVLTEATTMCNNVMVVNTNTTTKDAADTCAIHNVASFLMFLPTDFKIVIITNDHFRVEMAANIKRSRFYLNDSNTMQTRPYQIDCVDVGFFGTGNDNVLKTAISTWDFTNYTALMSKHKSDIHKTYMLPSGQPIQLIASDVTYKRLFNPPTIRYDCAPCMESAIGLISNLLDVNGGKIKLIHIGAVLGNPRKYGFNTDRWKNMFIRHKFCKSIGCALKLAPKYSAIVRV
jgi:hypothetical protein